MTSIEKRSSIALHAIALVTFALLALPVTHAAEPDWRPDLATWRAERATSLRAPDGWFSLIGLDWLTPGRTTVGNAADNRIRLASSPATHLAVLNLGDDQVSLEPPPEGFPSSLTVAEKPAQAGLLTEDSPLHIDSLTLVVIHRGSRFALRVKDANAPTRLAFHGLHWYAPVPALRITARWVPYTPPHDVIIPTVLGTTLHEKVPGAAEFTLHGKTVRLEPIVENQGELFFILRDQTSHTTTYGAARFLNTPLPDHGLAQPGTLMLDFNRLTNPPCAYTAYATCPLPPPQNILSIAIPAGEKRYHDE